MIVKRWHANVFSAQFRRGCGVCQGFIVSVLEEKEEVWRQWKK